MRMKIVTLTTTVRMLPASSLSQRKHLEKFTEIQTRISGYYIELHHDLRCIILSQVRRKNNKLLRDGFGREKKRKKKKDVWQQKKVMT